MFLAALALATVSVLIFQYAKTGPTAKELVDFVAKALFGFAGFASLAVALQALLIAANRARIDKAFEFLAKYDAADFIEVRNYLDNEQPIPADNLLRCHQAISSGQAEGLYLKINSNESIKIKVRLMLAFFEDMALAIGTGHADESVLFRSLRPSVIFYLTRLMPYIKHFRTKENDTLYYEDAVKLAQAWNDQRSVLTGKRVPNVWNESVTMTK